MFTLVDPLRTESGALAALTDSLGEEGAMPTPLKDKQEALSSFKVVSDSLSISAAAKLNVGSIFSGSSSLNDKGFYFDAMTFTDQYDERKLPDKSIFATRWGIGIRVLLRVHDIRGSASLNFGLVGAAVELQQARAQYEITGIGIGIDGLVIVLEELPTIGDFKYETYLKLNGAVVKKLAKYINENKTRLEPEPVAVALAKPIDPLEESRSVYFGMRCIADRLSLARALSKAGVNYDRETIRKVYLQVVGDGNQTATPSKEIEKSAESWLKY